MKYIKDSRNYYIIYLNQGEDMELLVPLTYLDLFHENDVDTTYVGEARQHSASSKAIPITATVVSTNLKLSISSDESVNMKSQKYLFDIFVTQDDKKKVALTGEIVVKRTITRT